MKISKYTIMFDEEEQHYVYNTLSNALISLNDDYYELLKDAQNNNLEVNETEYDKELFDVLKASKIITENDKDDFLIYKSTILQQREFNDFMHPTLAPTMDCCFRCHYCFEKYKNKVYMQPETMNAIIKYINSINTLKSLSITWFGGEPLMATKQIEQFYDKLNPYLKDLDFEYSVK